MKYIKVPQKRVSIDEILKSEKREFWNEVVCREYVNIGCDYREDTFSEGNINWIGLGDLRISEAYSSSQKMFRGSNHIASETERGLIVNLHLSGIAQFTQAGAQHTLLPGDIVFNETTETCLLDFDTPFHQLLVQIPKSALSEMEIKSRHLSYAGIKIPGRSSLGEVIYNFLTAVIMQQQLSGDDSQESLKLSKQITELIMLSATNATVSKTRLPNNIVKTATKAKVERYIDKNLTQTNLTLTSIAEANNISVRSLHKLYEDTETTAYRHIKHRRLQMAASLLSTKNEAITMSMLAQLVGFNDLPYFSRSFKNLYGISPSRYRERCLDDRSIIGTPLNVNIVK